MNSHSKQVENGTAIIDPYVSGIEEYKPHARRKRDLFDGISFRLEAPSVDWRMLLGSESVGAAFGLIMYNLLDLNIRRFNFDYVY